MKESIHLIIVLTIVSSLAGLLIAMAESKTRDPINQARERALVSAIKDVLPPDTTDPAKHWVTLPDGSSNEVYIADGAIAMKAGTPNGYSGDIELMLGFTADNRLFNYRVLEHRETPGLGAKICNEFQTAVTNRPAASDWKVDKDGGEIDSITAATISSRAVCEAIASVASQLENIRRELENGTR